MRDLTQLPDDALAACELRAFLFDRRRNRWGRRRGRYGCWGGCRRGNRCRHRRRRHRSGSCRRSGWNCRSRRGNGARSGSRRRGRRHGCRCFVVIRRHARLGKILGIVTAGREDQRCHDEPPSRDSLHDEAPEVTRGKRRRLPRSEGTRKSCRGHCSGERPPGGPCWSHET